MVVALWLLCCAILGLANASEICLTYPRLEAGQDSFRYQRDLDSTFVFGYVRDFKPSMSLVCNGNSINLTKDGAFLAFLPIAWQAETFAWNFTLTNGGVESSHLNFAFSEVLPQTDPEWMVFEKPATFKVTDPTAHTRTCIGGSYHLFPSVGTNLVVQAVTNMWLQFEIADGMTGVIERRFADSVGVGNVESSPIRIGNCEVKAIDQSIKIEFATSGRLLMEATANSSGDKISLTMIGAQAAIDRIHYLASSRKFVQDITWAQRPYGVEIIVDLAKPSLHGFQVSSNDSSVTLEIKYRDYKESGLRGKRIVLDPGHGGSADGAIGPRGNKEKDIVLHWSEILEKELLAQGCDVMRTRTEDVAVALHERVKLSREFDADVCLSLHANALPDGENPSLRRGCGSYYYQSLSRNLAESIQSAIVEETGISDDGVFDANFAVVRPTDFPTVLIEAAYLLHPEEELMLRDEKFLHSLSRGVVNGLLNYFSKGPAR